MGNLNKVSIPGSVTCLIFLKKDTILAPNVAFLWTWPSFLGSGKWIDWKYSEQHHQHSEYQAAHQRKEKICLFNHFEKYYSKNNPLHRQNNAPEKRCNQGHFFLGYPAAAAKSLQLCPTLCDPIDGSPPGSPSLGFSRQEHWSGYPASQVHLFANNSTQSLTCFQILEAGNNRNPSWYQKDQRLFCLNNSKNF